MKHPDITPDDLTNNVLTRIYTLGNRFVYREIALAFAGKWKMVEEEDMWWEDNNTMDDDDFWSMVHRLRDGKWRME